MIGKGEIAMKCPYCCGEMVAGGLHGLPNDIVYWLPKNTGVHFMVLTRKRIEEYGGIILSNKMNADSWADCIFGRGTSGEFLL